MPYSVGVDIGGTKIKFGLVDELGELVYHSSMSTGAEISQETVLDNIVKSIQLSIAAIQGPNQAQCIGIGSSGLVDVTEGYVKGGAPNLPDWVDLPLAKTISSRLSIPVYVDNDANVMGWGEFKNGNFSSTETHIFLTIGTGIGGAIIHKGELMRGNAFAGSELGCIPMNHQGESGYWEDFCSTSALLRRYNSKKAEAGVNIDGKQLISRYHQHEPLAREIMTEHFDLLGQGIGGLINIFNPSNIILGGGISEAGQFYIDGVRERAEHYALSECLEGVSFTAAALGNTAGLVGAALLAFEMDRSE